jgi:hypothetical protein
VSSWWTLHLLLSRFLDTTSARLLASPATLHRCIHTPSFSSPCIRSSTDVPPSRTRSKSTEFIAHELPLGSGIWDALLPTTARGGVPTTPTPARLSLVLSTFLCHGNGPGRRSIHSWGSGLALLYPCLGPSSPSVYGDDDDTCQVMRPLVIALTLLGIAEGHKEGGVRMHPRALASTSPTSSRIATSTTHATSSRTTVAPAAVASTSSTSTRSSSASASSPNSLRPASAFASAHPSAVAAAAPVSATGSCASSYKVAQVTGTGSLPKPTSFVQKVKGGQGLVLGGTPFRVVGPSEFHTRRGSVKTDTLRR